jgi:ABC-type sulfate transport system substrate-binding protein
MLNWLLGKKQPAAPMLHHYDFEKDTKFLFSLIATQIENERFKLQIHKKNVLSDNDVIEISKTITQDVMETMSESYLQLLYRYVDEEKLIDFVSTVVVKNTVQLGLTINRNVV